MRFRDELVWPLLALTLSACAAQEPTERLSGPPQGTTPSPTASPFASPAAPSPVEAESFADVVQATYQHQTGRFVERRQVMTQGTIIRWVDYDLSAGVQDHRIVLQEEGQPERSRDDADLRFVISEDRAVMWNPAMEEVCGSPWVEMPPELFETAGVPIEATSPQSVPPLDLLELHAASARMRTGGFYEVAIPAADLLPATALAGEHAEVIAELADYEVFVDVRTDDGLVTAIEADLSAAMAAAFDSAPVDEAMVFSWQFLARHEPDIEEPADVANGDCLEA